MSVTSGFFNSVNSDRKYDAVQMSSIFDGIIRDGVIQHYGSNLMVTSQGGMIVSVGTGRAWFNHTWTLNDSVLPFTIEPSEILMNRIDTVVLEVNATTAKRENSIYVRKGTPAMNPVPPTLVKSEQINQYPLADIYVHERATGIRQEDITNRVGTSATPFVTAPLEKMDIDALIAQWQDQFENRIVSNLVEFQAWFEGIKGQLSEDAAGHIQLQLDALSNQAVKKVNGISPVNGNVSISSISYADTAGSAVDQTARTSAQAAQDTASQALQVAQSASSDKMPIAGGTFTGPIVVPDTLGNAMQVRNGSVLDSNWNPTGQTVRTIYYIRKGSA